MRLLALSLLLGAIAASPVDYQQSLLYNSKQRAMESGAFVGWYDPRTLGGRFLDVRRREVFESRFFIDWLYSSPPEPRGNLLMSTYLAYQTLTS